MDVTPSSIKTFLTCPRKYYYAYELLLKPKTKSPAFVVGTIVHECLRSYYADSREFGAHPLVVSYEITGGGSKFKMWGLEEEKLYILNEASSAYGQPMDKNLATILGQLGGYMALYPRNEFVEYIGEKSFSVGIGDDKGKGKKDAIIVTSELKKRLLLDYKTTSEDLIKFREKMDYDLQPLFYLWAHWKECGEILDGVLYRTLKKPLQRQRQGESDEAFCDRIMKSYFKEPEKYFDSFVVYKNIDDLKWFEAELGQYIQELKRARKLWPRNSQRCFDYGGCGYYSLCQNQEVDKYLVEQFFDKKTKMHEEVGNGV